MAKKWYEGPAGIFGTDDWAADQRQVDAENYDPDEYEGQPDEDENDLIPEEETESNPLPMFYAYVGSSGCEWWKWDWIEESSYPTWMEEMKAKHERECGCSSELDYCHWEK